MSSRRRALVAAATAAVLTLALVTFWIGGFGAVGGALATLSTLSGLIGGLYTWGKRQPSRDEIAATEEAVYEETLRRTVKALPDLVSFQGLLVLDAEPRLRLVHDPLNRVDHERIDSVDAAFDASQGRLLIVGAPASGKTISAYRIAGQLAGCRDEQGPPILVNLSAWGNQENFRVFLIDYLCDSGAGYRLPNRRVVQAWLDAGKYQLLLDGLDEVPAGWRMDVLDRLEHWLPVGMRLVLTCRTADYDGLLRKRPRGISLATAVELQSLDDAELDRACAEVASKREELCWNRLLERSDPDVQAAREALRTPLLLNLAAGGGLKASELLVAGSRGVTVARTFIIDQFLRSCTESDPELSAWVGWIAAYLEGQQSGPFRIASPDSSVFEMSRLTPERCPLRIVGAACAALVVGGIVLAGAIGALSEIVGIALFMAVILLILPMLLVPQLRNALPSHVHVRSLTWRRLVRSASRAAALLLVVFALNLFVFSVLVADPSWLDGFLFGLAFGLPAAAIYLSWQLMRPSRVRTSSFFDGPWRESRRSAWFVAFAVWAIASVVTSSALLLANEIDAIYRFNHDFIQQGLATATVELFEMLLFSSVLGLVVAAHAALNAGGWFLILQIIATRRLARRHDLRGKPLAVLERGMQPAGGRLPLLRPVGSGARFIHNDVKERLAAVRPDGARQLP